MSTASPETVKECCSAFYGTEAARLLLGESFHPGGTRLTERLGRLLNLTPSSRVLDVAAGRGSSAFHLSETFGCEVLGIDLSEANVQLAGQDAARRGLTRVSFQLADAERLPFEPATFDAVICECAFCTFPDKSTAAREFARVLRPGGRVGLSDLTRTESPLPDLNDLLAVIACIGDARPADVYSEILQAAGLETELSEDHSPALVEMVRSVQGKLSIWN